MIVLGDNSNLKLHILEALSTASMSPVLCRQESVYNLLHGDPHCPLKMCLTFK